MVQNQTIARDRCFAGTLLWFVIPLLALIAIDFLTWQLWLEDRSITAENNLLENLQLLLLILSFVIHGYRRFQESVPDFHIYHTTLALLCFSLALREFDIDKIGSSEIWSSFEIFIRSIAVCAWVVILFRLVQSFSKFWTVHWRIFWAPKSLLNYIAIAFYIASWFFDKGFVAINPDASKYIEESFQLAATGYFLAGAMIPRSYPRTTRDSPSR